jgi:uncharacterized protein DUF6689
MLIAQRVLRTLSRYVGPLAIAACVLAPARDAFAQANIPITVSGNEATAIIRLPGGIGAELSIIFEQVVGLNPNALEVSAALVDPNDIILLARLGGGGLIVPPIAFPVLIRIEPSPSSALSFSGTVALSLHTHNLNLVPYVPLGLHTASVGGSFRDMTRSEGIGSYRAGGTGGGFSEFIIVVDRRQIDTVISGKFDAAEALLNEHGPSIPGPVLADLQQRIAHARVTYTLGATVAAIGEVTAFADVVRANSGAIPDVWRAHDSRVNVAGLLRAAADTLKFSLHRKASQ